MVNGSYRISFFFFVLRTLFHFVFVFIWFLLAPWTCISDVYIVCGWWLMVILLSLSLYIVEKCLFIFMRFDFHMCIMSVSSICYNLCIFNRFVNWTTRQSNEHHPIIFCFFFFICFVASIFEIRFAKYFICLHLSLFIIFDVVICLCMFQCTANRFGHFSSFKKKKIKSDYVATYAFD